MLVHERRNEEVRMVVPILIENSSEEIQEEDTVVDRRFECPCFVCSPFFRHLRSIDAQKKKTSFKWYYPLGNVEEILT